jgi:hypothetical protein
MHAARVDALAREGGDRGAGRVELLEHADDDLSHGRFLYANFRC